MNADYPKEFNSSNAEQILAEKEKDLELAAKIGQSLLEQNRELQNRNEFLEEALNASNDAIVQLRHELQMRATLLHMYADYDNELEASTSANRDNRSNGENLQHKVKRLEEENRTLKNESATMKKFLMDVEDKERMHITEWTKQLDEANEKVNRLQLAISEKNEECVSQCSEVERLLEEVAVRSTEAKALVKENASLRHQFELAVETQEELTSQIYELQERYTEVFGMLRDAEEELKNFRQRQIAYRSSSTDSLYDSLASELEASDSGFYSAISTSRNEVPHMCVLKKGEMVRVRGELEQLKAREARRSLKYTAEMRSVAVSTDPLPANRSRQISHSGDDVVDVPSNALAELYRRSRQIEQTHFPVSNIVMDTSLTEELEMNLATTSTPTVSKDSRLLASKPSTSHDVTISPQHHESETIQDMLQIKPAISRDINRLSGRSTCSSASTLSKTTSSESLANYEGPKMGEPGRPGTRDLDWSIRRLNIRKQIEQDYARFRRERGLQPPKISSVSNKGKPARSVFRRRSIKALCSKPCESSAPYRLTISLARIFKPWKFLSNVGLLASIDDGLKKGVLFRTSIPSTPPGTPIKRVDKNMPGDIPDRYAGSSYLIEALGLSLPSKSLPFSLFSKRSLRWNSTRDLRMYVT